MERADAYLILADGSRYRGTQFGVTPPSVNELLSSRSSAEAGEVVFNTSMSGYHEIITDPSYTGQIVLMTYPHIGNYGSDAEWNENGPNGETGNPISVCGLIVRDYYDGPIPPGRVTLDQFMKDHGVSGISGIDTRKLTLSLRDEGSRNGIIIRSEENELTDEEYQKVLKWLEEQPEMIGRDLVHDLTPGEVRTLEPTAMVTKNPLKMVLIDCGIKGNIVREMRRRGVEVTLLPGDTSAAEILALKPDGLLVSNGPGDPAVLSGQIAMVKGCIGTIPVFGICLGHQLISLALGAKTYKMKFGHHGGNHPVRDAFTGKVFVTAQNHGFAVDESTLPAEVEVWFTNANDQSLEGIAHKTLPVRSVQFHPEAAPGPLDAGWIFDTLIEEARKTKN